MDIAIVLSVLTILTRMGLHQLQGNTNALVGTPFTYYDLTLALVFLLLGASLLAWSLFARQHSRWTAYKKASDELDAALRSNNLQQVQLKIAEAQSKTAEHPLVALALESRRCALNEHMDRLALRQANERLNDQLTSAKRECDQRLADFKNRHPLIVAEKRIREVHGQLELRQKQIAQQWQQTYNNFSWFNKMKYSAGPDFKEMNQTILNLRYLHAALLKKHEADFGRLETHLKDLRERAFQRLATSESQLSEIIGSPVSRERTANVPFTAALWFSALSLPLSAWSDINTAGNIYDTLRNVNGNYAGMSDTEIWWQTLFMPTEQLVGLASLTKGAYFEQLVAADTGGTLFEHFNNPGTDIVIDGVAYQIKATDSIAYVGSVDPGIPVFATSEVAEYTRAIDAGYSNAELENSVNLALGGSVIDIKDTTVDALLAGLGGLGLFATLQGINHAAERYNNGGHGVEAVFEGVGVAVEGTARALVGTAELGYKVLMSRPSRFVGRGIRAGFIKLDDKMMGKKSEGAK
ncbi:MAG: hypothetical protein Q8L06_22305 [Pseudohongiella sp.]|nr:hypothetical protein [Pseudohongiella sp.]